MGPTKNTEILFDANENYVIIKLNGLFAAKDILKCFGYVVTHDDHKSGMNRIWELSEAQFETLDNEDMDLFSDYSFVFHPEISDVREALVSKSKGNWFLMKLFQISSLNATNRIEVFDSLKEGINWITTFPA